MAFRDGYLSELIGRQAVLDGPGDVAVGKVVDVYVGKPDDTFPRIDGIVMSTRGGQMQSPIHDVIDVDRAGTIVLRIPPTERPLPDDRALFLVKDLFDKQIVDVDGRKVVRINDIEIANTGGTLRVVAAEIGVAGLLRRLGARRIAPGLLDRVPRMLIAWDNVAPISELNPSLVRLSVSESRLSRLHPSELADIIGDLSAKDAARVVGSLDDETAADAFEHLEADVQQSIIADLGEERAADIIEEMDADDAADLLGELDEVQRAALLAKIEDRAYADDRENPRARAGVGIHLLSVRHGRSAQAARHDLAAYAAPLAADGIHSQVDGFGSRERRGGHERGRRRLDDRALRLVGGARPRRRRPHARHRDRR
jgi:sporulation protein YlmC with PRC-barrel domain